MTHTYLLYRNAENFKAQMPLTQYSQSNFLGRLIKIADGKNLHPEELTLGDLGQKELKIVNATGNNPDPV